MALYFVASIVAYRLEDRPLRLGPFLERYRISGLRGKDWLGLAALLGSFAIISVLISSLGPRLSAIPLLAPPASFPPELDSSKGGLVAGRFMGMTVWVLHHAWQGWTLVILVPYSFLWCYIIQRGRNNLIPIVVHGLANTVPLVMIVVGVAG